MTADKALRRLFLAPSSTLVLLLVVMPLLVVCAYSFLMRGAYGGVIYAFSADNYARVLQPIYLQILWRSIWIAALATVLCLLLGFPLALFIVRAGRPSDVAAEPGDAAVLD